MANGGLTGMRKYFEEIKKEDLRSFVSRHANSENGGVLIPNFNDVFNIVKQFDEYDSMYFEIGVSELAYSYDYYCPDKENHIFTEKLKLSSLPLAIDENMKAEFLFYILDICSNQLANRARKSCSYCGEKCFKFFR
ncbi:hypothetical protein CEXT_200391 [Caerostris extrusa]|uniref:Uncharacterized protein n=1 Tax=Caerostris extrusa TaxID=172846 RepID=A0AAV4QQG5_CAEEX|nr:hypothetical protein CEXT_200391 [Caerostris extrusa]